MRDSKGGPLEKIQLRKTGSVRVLLLRLVGGKDLPEYLLSCTDGTDLGKSRSPGRVLGRILVRELFADNLLTYVLGTTGRSLVTTGSSPRTPPLPHL